MFTNELKYGDKIVVLESSIRNHFGDKIDVPGNGVPLQIIGYCPPFVLGTDPLGRSHLVNLNQDIIKTVPDHYWNGFLKMVHIERITENKPMKGIDSDGNLITENWPKDEPIIPDNPCPRCGGPMYPRFVAERSDGWLMFCGECGFEQKEDPQEPVS